MNWTEVLTIILSNVAVLAAFFLHLINRMDKIKSDLDAKIDLKTDAIQKELNRIESKVSNIEGQITQMTRPNVIPLNRYQMPPDDDHAKEM